MADHVDITVRLPVLNPGDSSQAVGSVQEILNDFARFNGEETLLNQSFEFGPQTTARVKKFQQENSIAPATGGVGVRTWKALLQAWLPLQEPE
jgi:peptidoglycan hydrolase-like protein with peptidoglycan-binding domain